MNIEEAIKILKQEPDFSLNYYNRENATDVLLTAYEKQSKEIEELKEENRTQRKQLNDAFDRGWVHEDKIKAKIEEYEKMKEATKMDTTYYGEKRRSVIEGLIVELQSLLEKE